jgi:hypothetical protein
MRNDKELLILTGKVLSDSESVERFKTADSYTEIQQIFNSRGIDISDSEVIRVGELLNDENLSEEMLDTVTGGAAREMILLGGIIVSLVAVGACRAAYLSIKKD